MAWLRLGKIAVFSVLAMLAAAGGLAVPGGDAEAQGAFGGYTYTQRVCQEYGQQPRWYNVRDGQAAYNGGNSDSGWLIVLEHGGGVPARWVGVSADIALPGTTLSFGTHYGDGTDFVLRATAPAYLPNPWREAVNGTFAKIRNNGDDSDYVLVVMGGYAINRYNKIHDALPGGQYVRWAHIAWCR